MISKTKRGEVEHAEYTDNVAELVKSLKQKEGKDIYCDGGADIMILGHGIRLFKDLNIEQHLQFKRSISYPSGLVQLCYELKTNISENGN